MKRLVVMGGLLVAACLLATNACNRTDTSTNEPAGSTMELFWWTVVFTRNVTAHEIVSFAESSHLVSLGDPLGVTPVGTPMVPDTGVAAYSFLVDAEYIKSTRLTEAQVMQRVKERNPELVVAVIRQRTGG